MKIHLTIVSLFAVLAIQALGQTIPPFSNYYSPGTKLYVYAEAGLSLRQAPSPTATVLMVVKFGETVQVLTDTGPKVPFISTGVTGHWVKVNYGGKTGYQFDGFLSRYPPIVKSERGEKVANYLISLFKVTKELNTIATDSSHAKYTIDFENGIHYEAMPQSIFMISVKFPEKTLSYHEVFLMSRLGWNYCYQAGCPYAEPSMLCENTKPEYLRLQLVDHNYELTWFISEEN